MAETSLSFDPVSAVADGVGKVADMVGKLSPSEERKAVNAAEDAAKFAQKQMKRMLPKCETDREYKKKIEPLELPDVNNRAQYNFFRAKQLQSVYKEAYDEVMRVYRERVASLANGQQQQTAQEQLQEDSFPDSNYPNNNTGTYQSKASMGGCAPAAALLFAVVSLVGGAVYGLCMLV